MIDGGSPSHYPAFVELLGRLLSRLAQPRATWVVIAGAMLLSSPALFTPLVADDLIQQIRMRPDRSMSPFDDPNEGLFVFGSGDPAQRSALMEEGICSWWTAEDFQLAFWRPLSSLTHRLDFALWGDDALLIHAHSLLWFLFLLLALSRLYGRFHLPKVAVLALALYGLDDARGFVFGFASNRNALIAAVFGVCTLIVHDRWRREGWRPGAIAGPLLLGLGLLSAELALSTAAFLFAYALYIDQGTLRSRLGRLLPYGLVVVGWQLVYSWLGYGVRGSGIYVHPLADPLHFGFKLVERLPVLALAQLAVPPSDPWPLYPPPLAAGVYVFTLVLLVGLGKLLWPLVAKDSTLRFWLLGALLSLVPISATFANDRLLVFVGIGAAGALACVFANAVDTPPTGVRRRVILALAVVHLLVAPLLLPLRSLTIRAGAMANQRADDSVSRDPSVAHRSLVVLQVPADGMAAYPFIHRAARGVPRPRTVRLLSSGLSSVQVTRLDARTLRVRPFRGFYATEAEQMVRSGWLPFAVGQTIALSNMQVTITQVNDAGRALEADFRFARPLDAPEWLWTRWSKGRFVSWVPPPVGGQVTLPSLL